MCQHTSRQRRGLVGQCDECLRDEVQTRLCVSGRAGLRCLCVTAHDGEVRLSGGLLTFYEKQVAQEIVKSIDGVRCIVNNAAVGPVDQRDVPLRTQINTAHSRDQQAAVRTGVRISRSHDSRGDTRAVSQG
jgi:hypothetical protein